MEIWKPIYGFESLYEISNFGNVRRIARGKILLADQINKAKDMFENGEYLSTVASFLSVSVTTAFNIKHGRTWSGDANYRAVKTHVGSDHYIRFSACKNGKYRKVAIHRAIWEAFIAPIPQGLEINHKNLDRADNRIENLELVTHQENIIHAQEIYAKQRTHIPKGKRRGPRSKYAINVQHQ
jgi:hypothetical protein